MWQSSSCQLSLSQKEKTPERGRKFQITITCFFGSTMQTSVCTIELFQVLPVMKSSATMHIFFCVRSFKSRLLWTASFVCRSVNQPPSFEASHPLRFFTAIVGNVKYRNRIHDFVFDQTDWRLNSTSKIHDLRWKKPIPCLHVRKTLVVSVLFLFLRNGWRPTVGYFAYFLAHFFGKLRLTVYAGGYVCPFAKRDRRIR